MTTSPTRPEAPKQPGAPKPPRAQFDVGTGVEQIRAGSRAWIARAITLVESSRPDHRRLAQQLLVGLGRREPGAALEGTGGTGAVRVGVSGVPGAGKSTFINALGGRLIDAGHSVAVLAV